MFDRAHVSPSTHPPATLIAPGYSRWQWHIGMAKVIPVPPVVNDNCCMFTNILNTKINTKSLDSWKTPDNRIKVKKDI